MLPIVVAAELRLSYFLLLAIESRYEFAILEKPLNQMGKVVGLQRDREVPIAYVVPGVFRFGQPLRLTECP